MNFLLNNEEATFNICRSMRQSGVLQSVSAIFYKEKMKKDNDLKSENESLWLGFFSFREFKVELASGQARVQMDWPLLDYPSIPS